ncbi:MAG: 4-hydroxythreonine-4-phosphate dehydrogenase PdxA [Planctomycetota bacterium]|nr:4-hydroxythreonine-4-phosphate dehydrogenase PdxA [Planctomycetota bacterium]
MNSSSTIPVIGVTIGDPLGIGPEVVVKALNDPDLHRSCRFIVYGRNELMALAADRAGIRPYWFRVARSSDRAQGELLPPVTVVDFDDVDFHPPHEARSDATAGHLSKAFVEEAITDAMRDDEDERRVDAIVTGPICKESWAAAGFRWPGHTELLAHRTRSRRQAMAFVSPRLRVVLATAHVPLMDVKNVLTIGRVHESIEFAHELGRDLGIERPRIAVCGLNPHAGENGLLGDEDQRVIKPGIEVAKSQGLQVTGPHPADTIFIGAASGEHDVVVAMYHDQGLIPVKLLGWDKAVNVTLGLPIVRTSPDHGTAFGIAGRNEADAGSMRAAIDLALGLAAGKPSGSSIHG